MVMFNKLILAGNLTRDPETSFMPSGKSSTKFALAVNEKYKSESGEPKETVTFIDVVVYGKVGENCAEYLRKGSPALIEGKLRQRRWEKDGQKFSKHEIVAQAVQFLGTNGGQRGGSPEGDEPPEGDDVPY